MPRQAPISTPDATTETDTATETEVRPAERKPQGFKDLTNNTLAKTDLSTLDADGLREYAEVAQARLDDLTGSVYVDKRNGIVYLGNRQVGNVNRPIKASAVIPSKLKAKEEHITKGGEVHLPEADAKTGLAALDGYLVALCRFSMARIHGNGVNLIGQKMKDDAGVANALASVKSAMA